MFGIHVNPATIQKGDKIATASRVENGQIVVLKSRQVKRAGVCPSKSEMYHIEDECYDTRFTTVVKAI